jgi:hypothetical protein
MLRLFVIALFENLGKLKNSRQMRIKLFRPAVCCHHATCEPQWLAGDGQRTLSTATRSFFNHSSIFSVATKSSGLIRSF